MALLLCIPLTLFFTFWKGGLAGMALGDDSPYLLTFSAVVAVVAVNIILCVYVVVAFSEDVENDEKPKKN